MEPCTVVLDCGSYLCRVGLAGEDSPTSLFPTLVGHPKQQPSDHKSSYHNQLNLKTSQASGMIFQVEEADLGIKLKDPLKEDLLLIGMIWNPFGNIHSTICV